MRLVLGTAQLGMDYGIANPTGKPDQSCATEIVQTAWDNGIRQFDTAQAYGTSETVLGKAFSELGIAPDVKVISKFHPDIDHTNPEDMKQAARDSLKRIGISRLHALMIHREEHLLLWQKGLGDALFQIKQAGMARHIGVCVYSPEFAIQALETDGIDAVQVPGNIFDRRFEQNGVFELAKKEGKTVYIRSVFLQGLILMPLQRLPRSMAHTASVLEKLDRLCETLHLTRQETALGYIKNKLPDAKVLIGAELPCQVKENIECWKQMPPVELGDLVTKTFDHLDENILNPAKWNQ